MKRIVVLSGAGISAESGLKTFRDMGGLWESFAIEDVATPEGWKKDPELVLEFYNKRRAQAASAFPNAGHNALSNLQKYFEVHIITQNVDNLHERAGSENVLHLHGELSKVRSEQNENLIYEIEGGAIKLGDKAEDKAQLRPHIVWFGEQVPLIDKAADICSKAELFIVVGTSLQVYPAAGLVSYVPKNVPIFVVNPAKTDLNINNTNLKFIEEPASLSLPKLAQELVKKFK